ncbi:MAG: hypothetical protein GVY24_02375 [Planctomycetes bacterium]|jgi:hypothetical protein|nr:hypothetical protein [Planctomycetota bacterium]
MLISTSLSADLFITEIMYNPKSPEGRWPDRNDPEDEGEPTRTEWVEIHNAGSEPIEMAGYHLADEDGQTLGLPEGAVIQPGQTVVLIPGDCAVSEFHEAWGEGITAWQLGRWGRDGLNNLANSPSQTNEALELRDAEGETVDRVNYDDEGAWPSDQPSGPSIYLKRGGFDPVANDAGANWARSEPGIDGAKTCEETDHFTGQDVGSPGTLPPKIEDAEPVPLPDASPDAE